MSNNIGANVWLIGTGYMGIEYAKVLTNLEVSYQVIGRSVESTKAFETSTNKTARSGGLEKWLKGSPPVPDHVIVAVSLNQLKETTSLLLDYGIKNILVEKPAGLKYEEVEFLSQKVISLEANIFVAYNRRFYASTLKAMNIIKEDGGVSSFNFEFTEWSHKIEKLNKPKNDLENWFFVNSTHVVDLAFFIGGLPSKLVSFTAGSLDWYSKASRFAGCGITDQGALFNYSANWKSPGRWAVEIITPKHRLIFKPLEKLQIQEIGSVKVNFVEEIDYSLDEDFKPGLYKQTTCFLNPQSNFRDYLVTIQQHNYLCQKVYSEIENPS